MHFCVFSKILNYIYSSEVAQVAVVAGRDDPRAVLEVVHVLGKNKCEAISDCYLTF